MQIAAQNALDRVDGPIDAVFSCAGVADGTPGLMLINFISQRHIVDRLAASGKFAPRAAVAMISSGAGMGWQNNLPQTLDFLAHEDWASAAAWVDTHPAAKPVSDIRLLEYCVRYSITQM